jgi:hypothetical protein
MTSTPQPILTRLIRGTAQLIILCGAAGVLAGALSPWATFRVFHNIEINLPGIVFGWGGLCLAVAMLVFLGMRRSPILCLVGALLVLYETGEAQKRVPERVKFQLAGSQMEFTVSINRLLDQFHIPDIEVANLNTPNAELLGVGLGWTVEGAYGLLLGGLVGIPYDPVAVWLFTHSVRVRCRACGARRLLARPAPFCPGCGVSTLHKNVRFCPHCGTRARRGDRHCAACGTALPSATNDA